MDKYTIIYDYTGEGGFTEWDCREDHDTWEESQKAITSMRDHDGYSNIQLIQPQTEEGAEQ